MLRGLEDQGHLGYQGPLAQCHTPLLEAGIVAFDADPLDRLGFSVFENDTVSDVDLRAIGVDRLKNFRVVFDREPQPRKKLIAQEAIAVVCDGKIEHVGARKRDWKFGLKLCRRQSHEHVSLRVGQIRQQIRRRIGKHADQAQIERTSEKRFELLVG